MKQLVYLNGKLIPKEKAKISVFNRGLLYGDGCFETMRSYGGVVFSLNAHLGRLFSSLKILNIKIDYSKNKLSKEIYRTLKANSLKDAYIRLTVTRGEGLGVDLPSRSAPTIFIIITPLPKIFSKGVKAKTVKIKRNANTVVSSIKSLNYLDSIMARVEARSGGLGEAKNSGVSEAIFCNTEGCLAEAAASNLFLIKNNRVITPSLDSGILPGITRQVVIELAQRMKLKAEERKVKPSELFRADEAFLTNSISEVIPLIAVDGRPIGDGKIGRLTKSLQIAYQERVKKE